MLKGEDYKNIHMISPFLGEIVDTLYSQGTAAPITQVFALHVDLKKFIRNRFFNPSWTEQELLQFKALIHSFKSVALKLFWAYQALTMATSKWHALNHVEDSLRNDDGNEYLDVGCFESLDKRFKKSYSHISKNFSTAMFETGAKETFLVSENDTELNHVNDPRGNVICIKTVTEDPNFLVRDGKNHNSGTSWNAADEVWDEAFKPCATSFCKLS